MTCYIKITNKLFEFKVIKVWSGIVIHTCNLSMGETDAGQLPRDRGRMVCIRSFRSSSTTWLKYFSIQGNKSGRRVLAQFFVLFPSSLYAKLVTQALLEWLRISKAFLPRYQVWSQLWKQEILY